VTANDLVDPVWSVAAGSERRIRDLAVISGCGGKWPLTSQAAQGCSLIGAAGNALVMVVTKPW